MLIKFSLCTVIRFNNNGMLYYLSSVLIKAVNPGLVTVVMGMPKTPLLFE